MALDQRTKRAYVALSGEDEVDVIDVANGEVVDRIKLSGGDRPRELALTPDGRTLLVVNTGSNTVSIIDPCRCSNWTGEGRKRPHVCPH